MTATAMSLRPHVMTLYRIHWFTPALPVSSARDFSWDRRGICASTGLQAAATLTLRRSESRRLLMLRELLQRVIMGPTMVVAVVLLQLPLLVLLLLLLMIMRVVSSHDHALALLAKCLSESA